MWHRAVAVNAWRGGSTMLLTRVAQFAHLNLMSLYSIGFGNVSRLNRCGNGAFTWSWMSWLYTRMLEGHGGHLLGSRGFFLNVFHESLPWLTTFGVFYALSFYGLCGLNVTTQHSTIPVGIQQNFNNVFGWRSLTTGALNGRLLPALVRSTLNVVELLRSVLWLDGHLKICSLLWMVTCLSRP